MILSKVSFVDEFPRTLNLSDPIQVEMDVYGVLDFTIQDSIIIFSSKNPKRFWSIFSLQNHELRGHFLEKGNGPNEFLGTPWIYSTSFYTKNDELIAAIYDFYKGKVYEMNVGRTLAESTLSISIINESLPKNLFNLVAIDNLTFFCKEISTDHRQQERYLIDDGIKNIPANFEKLNRSAIMPREDINILSTITKRNKPTGRFVEIPLKLNYINIYSIDGSFEKTICLGKKLDKISDIQQLDRAKRILRHGYLCVYDGIFGVLCFNEEEKSYDLERKIFPTIQFFNIDGEPLVEFKLNRHATSFDIDFNNGQLYIHDFRTDELYKYDIQNIIVDCFRF